MSRGKGFWGALSASARGKASQDLGAHGEALCRALLARHGFVRIERIQTGWKVLFKYEGDKRVVKDAFPLEPVEGDFIAMEKGTGRKVLAEAKATEDDRIIFSRLEDHQVEALDGTVAEGGLAFLIVIIQGKGSMISWPIPEFKKGKALVQIGNQIFVK